METTYDFIIIGSGTSGGVLAHNLQQSGAKCLLIEAGKYFKKDTFPRNEADASTQLYWGGGMEFNESATMAFLRTRAVGGTSIVNQCLMNRFDDIAFEDWKVQSQVGFFNANDMSPYYDKVESALTLHTFDKSGFNNNAKKFTSACDELGYKWDYLQRGQSDCSLEKGNDCIGCLGGCHRDSKQSTMVAFIQKAEKNGLEILTGFNVDSLEHTPDSVLVKGEKSGKKQVLTGRKVILAGGSFGSTGILLRSGFKKNLPALGKYFSSHPQFMSFGIFDEYIDSHKGAFQSVASKDPSFRKQGFKLENVFASPIAIGMLFNSVGKRHQDLMKQYRNMACIEVAVRDEASGEIQLNKKGRLVIKKELTTRDKKRRDAGLEVIQNILSKSGAKEIVHSPYYFGLHLMGGCVIGANEQTSVVDPEFKVHGMDNIYISDSSIYPNAPGINPSLTIMALSQKLSEQLTH